MSASWSASSTSIGYARRLDPEFFDPRGTEVLTAVEALSSRPLREFASWASRGGSPKYTSDGELRVIKTAHVRRAELVDTPEEFVDRVGPSGDLTPTVPRRSLLVTSTGVGSAGRVFLHLDNTDISADGHVTVIPLSEPPLKAAYICAYLQSPAGRQQILRLHRGSSRQIEIYPEDLLDLEIPSLGAAQEREIGARWLSAVRSVRDARSAVRDAEMMIQEMLGVSEADLDTEPTIWSQDVRLVRTSGRLDPQFTAPRTGRLRDAISTQRFWRLSDLVARVRTGYQPPYYDEAGAVRIVKTKDVMFPSVSLAGCAMTDDQGWTDSLTPGDLLLNMTGEGTLGRAGIAPPGVADVATFAAIDVAAATLHPDILPPMYVALFLNSWMGREQTLAAQTGSSGQQHIYEAHFRSILVPVATTPTGSVDQDWLDTVVRLSERRASATTTAAATFEALDQVFIQSLGVVPDLSTIPA